MPRWRPFTFSRRSVDLQALPNVNASILAFRMAPEVGALHDKLYMNILQYMYNIYTYTHILLFYVELTSCRVCHDLCLLTRLVPLGY